MGSIAQISRQWWRGLLSLLAVVLATGIGFAADDENDDGLARPEFGKELVHRLLDPETRADAFYDFILGYEAAEDDFDEVWKNYPREIFDRVHLHVEVIECPQRDGGEPLIAVLYETNHSARFDYDDLHSGKATDAYPVHPEEDRRRRQWLEASQVEAIARGGAYSTWRPGDPFPGDKALFFLDQEGTLRWPFGGDNAISAGCLYDVNGDGILERVDYTSWGIQKGHDVGSLKVSTVEADPKALLQVVFNWHPRVADDANRWGFSVTDDDEDGLAEIGLGPVVDTRELRGPAEVTFRWDAESRRFVGPAGGKGKHWQVLSLESGVRPWEQMKAMNGLGYPLREQSPVVVDRGGDEDIFQPPPLVDWPQREPYQHQSLVGLNDEELFRFMWKGRQHLAEERQKQGAGVSDWRMARIPNEALALEPREAALAIAEANRTEEHQQLYELKFAVAENEGPPTSAVLVMESRGGGWTPNAYTDGVRYDDSDGVGEKIRCYKTRGGSNYPKWRGETTWYRDNIGAKAKWTAQTIWWLDRMRTVSRIEHEVDDNRGFGGDDIPVYQLAYTADWDENGNAMVREFPATQGFDIGPRWAGHYDRRIAASLTLTLWHRLYPAEMVRAGQKSEERDLGVVEHLLGNDEVLKDWPFVDFVRLAVESAGDRGWALFADELASLRERLSSTPDPFEEHHRTIEAAIDRERQAIKDGDSTARNRMWEGQGDLRKLASPARLHPEVQLRIPIQIAERQFAIYSDREALEKWALEENNHGAAWALRRLENFDSGVVQVDKILAVQTDGKAADNDWVFHELLRRNRSLAIDTWHGMPPPRRNRYVVSIYRALDPDQQRTEKWVQELVDFVGAEDAFLALNSEGQAIDLLIPPDEPMRFSDPQIEQAVADCLKSLNRIAQSDLDYSQKRLRVKTALALGRRDSAREHWELLLDAHEKALNAESRDDGIIRSALIKIVADHPELGQEFWLRLQLKDAHGRWNSFFLDVYAANLRLAKDDIARAATRAPDEREGPRADSWVSTEQTLKGGFHSARQVVSLWEEPDDLTRSKMQIAFGMRAVEDYGYHEVYRALDQLRKQLAADLPSMSAEEKTEIQRWIRWCRGKGAKDVLGGFWSPNQNDWLADCEQLLQR